MVKISVRIHAMQIAGGRFHLPSCTIYAVYLRKICFHKCNININYKNVENIKNYKILKITYHHAVAITFWHIFFQVIFLIHLKSRGQITYKNLPF